MDLFAALGEGFKSFSKVIDLFPNFEQRQVRDFRNLRKEYDEEVNKPLDYRNNDKLADLIDELCRRQESIVQSISKEDLASMRPSGRDETKSSP